MGEEGGRPGHSTGRSLYSKGGSGKGGGGGKSRRSPPPAVARPQGCLLDVASRQSDLKLLVRLAEEGSLNFFDPVAGAGSQGYTVLAPSDNAIVAALQGARCRLGDARGGRFTAGCHRWRLAL